jgi:hypothetical protein
MQHPGEHGPSSLIFKPLKEADSTFDSHGASFANSGYLDKVTLLFHPSLSMEK